MAAGDLEGMRVGAPVQLGAHLSIAKGFPDAFQLASRIGATTFQFFTRNPRGGSQRAIGDEEVAAGARARAEHGVAAVFAHLPYTVNSASDKLHAYEFAKLVLRDDLRLAARLGAEFAVVHPGSHVGQGVERGIERIVQALSQALDGYDGETWLCLETMAGQGSEIGKTPEELRAIMDGVGRPPRLGICLDSCHLFAAGYDLRTPDGVARMLDHFDRVIGLDRVVCAHLNDSKADLGSHSDRHAKIGQGKLGPAGVTAFVQDPFISRVPICLETPVDDPLEYAEEIRAVRDLLDTAASPSS